MLMCFTSLASLAVLSTLTTFVFQRMHLLMALLSLEATLLALTLYMITSYYTEPYSIFILLTFGACEASLGLACLVSMTRSYGSDMFKYTNSSRC